MSHPFAVGDLVVVLGGKLAGTVTTITAGPTEVGPSLDGVIPGGIGYEIDVENTYPHLLHKWPRAFVTANRLKPFYDGNEKVSWSSCVWQPNKVGV